MNNTGIIEEANMHRDSVSGMHPEIGVSAESDGGRSLFPIFASVLLHMLLFCPLLMWGPGRHVAENVFFVGLEATSSLESGGTDKKIDKQHTAKVAANNEPEPVEKAIEQAIAPADVPVAATLADGPETNAVTPDAAGQVRDEARSPNVDEGTGDEGQGLANTGRTAYGGSRNEYLDRIRGLIQGAVRYPPLARKRRLEGEVLAGFSIDGGGAPRDIRVLRSSGHGILDRAVIRIIRRASPYPVTDATVEVPVVFRLRDGDA
jgi:TonB family protein